MLDLQQFVSGLSILDTNGHKKILTTPTTFLEIWLGKGGFLDSGLRL
jgi:hypothetical protein